MGLPLTPQILAAAYEYLRATPPFRGWRLPPASEVRFYVTRHLDREGDHFVINRKAHVVRVSARVISHTNSLLEVIGHEMIHMHQWDIGDRRSTHNLAFRRLAHRVCLYHGWDELTFVGVI